MENVNPLVDKSIKVKVKKPNPIGRFFRAVFVHNFAIKALAIVVSVVLWVLVVTL